MQIIDILEALSTQDVVISCALCQGNGNLSYEQADRLEASPPCPLCGGRGVLLIHTEQLPLVKCARCHGTGSTYQPTTLNEQALRKLLDQVCLSCRGAGCQSLAGEWYIVRGPRPETVKTIHLSGMTADQFVDATENKKQLARCFVCRRQAGDDSIAFANEANPIAAPLELLKYQKRCGEVVYTWLICKECAWLFDLFSKA